MHGRQKTDKLSKPYNIQNHKSAEFKLLEKTKQTQIIFAPSGDDAWTIYIFASLDFPYIGR